MNLLHLLWIIPLCISAGVCIMAFFVAAAKESPVREIKKVRSGRAGE